MSGLFVLAIFGIALLYIINIFVSNRKWIEPETDFPDEWKIILEKKVLFYRTLSESDKKQFENDIHFFMHNYKIKGIKIKIDLTDKLLVASSGVIPIFEFREWKYRTLKEVLLYSGNFNLDFETNSYDSNMQGMVGSGYMEGMMLLSKPALHQGFDIESDKQNTAIHEFVHLIDKEDGIIDGIPKILLQKQYILPWLDLIDKEITKINRRRTDIDPYGATSRAEFFAVISEYFFERPELFRKKHPELYLMMESIFTKKKQK